MIQCLSLVEDGMWGDEDDDALAFYPMQIDELILGVILTLVCYICHSNKKIQLCCSQLKKILVEYIILRLLF